jgi:hypothetical protein
MARIPADSWRRGGLGGEMVEGGVVDGGRNISSELLLRTVSSDRGSSCRSRAQTKTKTSQGGAQGREEGSRVKRRGRGGQALPASSLGSCSTRGTASRSLGSLVVEEI